MQKWTGGYFYTKNVQFENVSFFIKQSCQPFLILQKTSCFSGKINQSGYTNLTTFLILEIFCPLNHMWYKKSSWLVKRIFLIARCLCWQLCIKVSDEEKFSLIQHGEINGKSTQLSYWHAWYLMQECRCMIILIQFGQLSPGGYSVERWVRGCAAQIGCIFSPTGFSMTPF